MSLYRFAYYSAAIGGWAAFLAWTLAKLFALRGRSELGTFRVTRARRLPTRGFHRRHLLRDRAVAIVE